MKITGGDVAKKAGLDLSRYSETELKKLDHVTDGKIDETEAGAAVRFADADGDGFVSSKEQRAFDHVVGKESSLASAKAFTELHEGRVDKLEQQIGGELQGAQQRLRTADGEHDQIVSDRATALRDSRAGLEADGIPISQDSPKELLRQMQELGDPDQLSPRAKAQLERLNRQYDHASLTEAFNGGADDSYADLKQSKAELRETQVQTNTVADLIGAARARMPVARAIVDSETAVKAAAGMRLLREVVLSNPQVKHDAGKLLKAKGIKAAVAEGKLSKSDVNMKKLEGDIATYERRVAQHTSKLESTARHTVQYMEGPEFKKAMEALPDHERARIEGGLHELVSDTKAGEAFFDKNLLPALQNAPGADPYYVKMLKGGTSYSKKGLSALRTWGGQIAKKGGPDAMKLLNNGVAQALAIKPSQVGKVHDAIEYANKHGMEAAQARLAKDPELGKLAGGFDNIAKGVSFATGVIAAYDLQKDPNLRNGLAAASSAAEVSSILAGAGKKSKALATYARFAGKVAPSLDIVVGGLDMKSAIKRGDTASAVGGGMQAAGGTMMLAAAATGVGLPLAVVGGVLSLGGAAVSAIWGDSPTEEWLKKNAPEYAK